MLQHLKEDLLTIASVSPDKERIANILLNAETSNNFSMAKDFAISLGINLLEKKDNDILQSELLSKYYLFYVTIIYGYIVLDVSDYNAIKKGLFQCMRNWLFITFDDFTAETITPEQLLHYLFLNATYMIIDVPADVIRDTMITKFKAISIISNYHQKDSAEKSTIVETTIEGLKATLNVPLSGKIYEYLKNFISLIDVSLTIRRMLAYATFRTHRKLQFLKAEDKHLGTWYDLRNTTEISRNYFKKFIATYLGNKYINVLIIQNYESIGLIKEIEEYCIAEGVQLNIKNEKDIDYTLLNKHATGVDIDNINIIFCNSEEIINIIGKADAEFKAKKKIKYILLLKTHYSDLIKVPPGHPLPGFLRDLEVIDGEKFQYGKYPNVVHEILSSICVDFNVIDFNEIIASCERYIDINYTNFDNNRRLIKNEDTREILAQKIRKYYDDTDTKLVDIYLDLFDINYSIPVLFKPLAFLLAGNAGTGKTYIAKCLSEAMFDERLFSIPMSNHESSHTFESWLFGTSAGYVGYDQVPDFQKFLEKCNNEGGIVLVDECDKADESCLGKFLEILQDGKISFKGLRSKTIDVSRLTFIFAGNYNINVDDQEVNLDNVSPSLKSRFAFIMTMKNAPDQLIMIKALVGQTLKKMTKTYDDKIDIEVEINPNILNHPIIGKIEKNGRALDNLTKRIFQKIYLEIYKICQTDIINKVILGYNNGTLTLSIDKKSKNKDI